MQKLISARHFELSDRIRRYAEDEMDALTKFAENITSCELVLTEETKHHRRSAELKVKAYNSVMTATASETDVYSAMKDAFTKVETQLKKHKEKLKEKDHDAIAKTKESATRPKTDVEEVE